MKVRLCNVYLSDLHLKIRYDSDLIMKFKTSILHIIKNIDKVFYTTISKNIDGVEEKLHILYTPMDNISELDIVYTYGNKHKICNSVKTCRCKEFLIYTLNDIDII